MAMTTMLLALAAAATALPEDHPTCLAACAGLSCARFAPATCAMVERDLGCACAGCACLGRRLAAAAASNDTLLNETLLNSTALNASAAPAAADEDDEGPVVVPAAPSAAPPPRVALNGLRPAESRSSRYRRRASLAASSAREDATAAAAAVTSRSVRRASLALSTPLARITVVGGSRIADHATSPVVSSRGRCAASHVAAYASHRRRV